MPDILDSKQLDRATMFWALFAYIVADLPDLLPRIDISQAQSTCTISDTSNVDDESADTIINMINVTCLTNAIREIVAVEHVDTPARF